MRLEDVFAFCWNVLFLSYDACGFMLILVHSLIIYSSHALQWTSSFKNMNYLLVFLLPCHAAASLILLLFSSFLSSTFCLFLFFFFLTLLHYFLWLHFGLHISLMWVLPNAPPPQQPIKKLLPPKQPHPPQQSSRLERLVPTRLPR